MACTGDAAECIAKSMSAARVSYMELTDGIENARREIRHLMSDRRKMRERLRKLESDAKDGASDPQRIRELEARIEELMREVHQKAAKEARDAVAEPIECTRNRGALRDLREQLRVKRDFIKILISRSRALWTDQHAAFLKTFETDQLSVSEDLLAKTYQDPAVLRAKLHEMNEDISEFLRIYEALKGVDSATCTSVGEQVILVDRVNALLRRIANHSEDISGTVRVYVRLRACDTDCIAVVANDQSIDSLECSGSKPFRNFYRVFHKNEANEHVYASMKPLFDQVEDGYHVVLFAYGYSGSGKTFTLLGKSGETLGVLQLGLRGMAGVKRLSLLNAFELRMTKVTIGASTEVTAQIGNFAGKAPASLGAAFEEKTQAPSRDWTDATEADAGIQAWLAQINEVRIARGTVKKTPNNKESSRSHLVLVLRVEFATGKTGFISVVDAAGREDPFAIFEKLFDARKLTDLSRARAGVAVKTASLIKTLLTTRELGAFDAAVNFKAFTAATATDLIKEGLYINESLNHLRYYFLSKSGNSAPVELVTDLDKYSPERFLYGPSSDQRIKMIPLLKWLDTGVQSDRGRPTKFAMVCAVRQERMYCADSLKTLEFAKSISST